MIIIRKFYLLLAYREKAFIGNIGTKRYVTALSLIRKELSIDMKYEFEMPEFLSEEYVKENGVLYDESVFSDEGLWKGILYDKPKDKGGKPFTGILYNMYEDGKIGYYIFFENGYECGPYATFYANGKPQMHLVKSLHGIVGTSYFWYENGNLKEIRIINEDPKDIGWKYIKWNEDGNLTEQGRVPKREEQSGE